MNKLRYFTAGESHGQALVTIIDGMPSQVPISIAKINEQLAKRQKGYGRGGRMLIEKDEVKILSGVRFSQSLGSPICLEVVNKDWGVWSAEMAVDVKPKELKREVTRPRPGHADLVGGIKYDHRDLRNILERASARETTMRVAAGAVARSLLESCGVQLVSYVVSLGSVSLGEARPSFKEICEMSEACPVRSIDPKLAKKMMRQIDTAKKAGDTLGGVVEVQVVGLPIGLGNYTQWDRKLDGRLAQALMSIQAIKGVEIGLGFEAAKRLGSQVHDSIYYDKKLKQFYRKTNGAGGLEGSMTTGEPLIIRAAMKPISTLYKPLHSVDINSKQAYLASIERSDTCAVPAAAVIAENVVAFTLADALLEKFGGDSLKEIKRNIKSYHTQSLNY